MPSSADPTHRNCPKCGRTKHVTRYGPEYLCTRCNNKETQRDLALQLRVLYGITLGDYYGMLERQGGVCALCNRPPTLRAKRLYVDHDHATGKVRGLLCNSCNSALGLLQDSPKLLRKAARYIERSANTSVTPPEGQQTLWD